MHGRAGGKCRRPALALRLTIPPVGLVEDFHLQVGAPCRAHHQKRAAEKLPAALENEKHLKRTLREKEVQNPEG